MPGLPCSSSAERRAHFRQALALPSAARLVRPDFVGANLRLSLKKIRVNAPKTCYGGGAPSAFLPNTSLSRRGEAMSCRDRASPQVVYTHTLCPRRRRRPLDSQFSQRAKSPGLERGPRRQCRGGYVLCSGIFRFKTIPYICVGSAGSARHQPHPDRKKKRASFFARTSNPSRSFSVR